VRLSELLRGVSVRATHGDTDVDISAVVADSRRVKPGVLFVAIPGFQADGAKFIGSAVVKGAVAIVANVAVDPGQRACTVVQVDDARVALAVLAANFFGRPTEKLSIVGVTGTSGKTTTTKMIESIFDATGEPAGLIGTIEYRAGDETLVADRTTPDAVVLQEWFAKMVDAGVRHAVMEVSSHALALSRTFGVRFAAAVFTNLSQDHFDFHKDFEDYYRAKRVLFDQIPGPNRAVVNADDEYGRRLIGELGSEVITFGRNGAIRPSGRFEISTRGLRGTLHTPAGDLRVDSKLLGMPNLYNWMGAVGAAIAVGIGKEQIEAGIHSLSTVRGRFEYVEVGEGGPTVIVDYAHKPDALEKLLHAVRDLAGPKRIIVLFGCGGDRDRGKRPQMGGLAARGADRVILTSDNPRSEKPDAILDDIEAGMTGATNYERIADRRLAIARTIEQASDDDVVVIAGKGHETYQVVGDQVLHFDDREEAELALKKRNDKQSVNRA
jgi:UDP-N-acetylmuramoyl-L-alanyl-D-glutamate--2,6-diaminopimelate ligase